jgi:hypothetical protein
MKKTFIFLETNDELDSITDNELNESIIFSFNIHTHKFLCKKSIEHTIAETYLSKEDHEEIFKTTISLWNWHKEKFIPKSLYHEDINLLGVLDTNELHQILVREIYRFLTIKRIIEKENPSEILCSQHFSDMINAISDNQINLKIFNKTEHDFLVVWDKILIRFNIGKIPISVPISRKMYTKIKNSIELFLGSFFNLWFHPNNLKKSILFVEYNPTQYVELLDNLHDYDGNLIFLNRRRSAMWNFKSINILKKFRCKIITPTKFLTKNEKTEIFDLSQKYLKSLDNLWSNSTPFHELFSIEKKSFWKSIDKILLHTYKKRLSEYIELITFSKKFLNNIKINSILSLNILGETEKAILDVNENKITSILLEHGGTNYVSEISLYDISNMYPIFKDKISLWGNIQKDYLTNVRKISDEKILVSGSPRHDSFFNKKTIQNNSSEKIILITPQVVQEYNAQTDTHTYLRVEELLKQIFSITKKLFDVKVIVKMHPTLDPGNEYVKKLIHELNPDVKIYQLESILDVIQTCDLMININTEFFPSTVIYEGLILKKPILNIYTMDNYYNFEFMKDNAMLTISDKMDLEESLHKILFDQNFCTELIKNGQEHLKKYFSNHGSASKELAKILKNY